MASNWNSLKTLALLCAFCLSWTVFSASASAQLFPKGRTNTGPKPKNIHGVVLDVRGTPLLGARVFIKDMKTSVVRTMETDATGEYKVFGLPPAVDYEIYAEF